MALNITLGYKAAGAPAYSAVGNILEAPAIGGSFEKLEVTALSDVSRRYMAWINDPGELVFKFLYDNSTALSSYRVLKGIEGTETDFEVTYPDGTKYDFTAQAAVSMDASKPGKIETFSAVLILSGPVTVTNPS